MFCPSCGHQLQKLTVTTTSGGNFEVDHCGFCGGTWFDPYEINRVPYHEVVRLASVTVLPKKPTNDNQKKLCPRCKKELIPYSGEAVPLNVRLFWCKKCLGIFATQKALEKFKQKQMGIVEEYKKRGVAFPSLSVVFVPAIMTVFLLVFTFISILNLQEMKDARINARENIQNWQAIPISSTTVAISFTSKTQVKSFISFGPSRLEFASKTISEKPALQHSLVLTNLQPETTYLFQITLEDDTGNRFSTELKSFTTTVPSESALPAVLPTETLLTPTPIDLCQCEEDFKPVCGQNYANYPNSCYAKCEGVEVLYRGECKVVSQDYQPDPSCQPCNFTCQENEVMFFDDKNCPNCICLPYD